MRHRGRAKIVIHTPRPNADKVAETLGLPKKTTKELKELAKRIFKESAQQEKLIKEGLKRMTKEELRTLREFLKGASGVEQDMLLGFVREVLEKR